MPQPAEGADVPIADAGRGERLRQRIRIELRVGTRARHRTHIDQQIDPGLAQQRDELGDAPGRMPDRENRGLGSSLNTCAGRH